MTRSRIASVASGLLMLGLLYGWTGLRGDDVAAVAPDGGIESLYEARRSGVVVEGAGTVERVLSDDLEGSRHQRLVVLLASGHTLLISHNIDLAPRVEGVRPGDAIRFRGQYEWNEHGGVVHWTHRDPRGERPGGWLRHAGRAYR